jgi:hypothetical protein
MFFFAKKVVNTIPSDSNFGKKDKMVRVSQTLDGKEANDQEVPPGYSRAGYFCDTLPPQDFTNGADFFCAMFCGFGNLK